MGSEKKPTPQLSHLDLLAIPQGGDSYALIGHPYDQSTNPSTTKSPIQPDKLQEEWLSLFTEYFPPTPGDRELAVNLADLALLPEPAIDRWVEQKTDELKKRQRELELQRKISAQDSKRIEV